MSMIPNNEPGSGHGADARRTAIDDARPVLTGRQAGDSARTVFLRRKDQAAPVAFLVSIGSPLGRMVVPLRQGVNVIARSDGIGDHFNPILDTAQRWCEAAQCHIFCDRSRSSSRAADRSSNGTFIFRRTRPLDELPRFQEISPRLPHAPLPRLGGSWLADPSAWTLIAEGDVLVCLDANWVFGWVPIVNE